MRKTLATWSAVLSLCCDTDPRDPRLTLGAVAQLPSHEAVTAPPRSPDRGRVARENALPGAPVAEWGVPAPPGDPAVQGFATPLSVDRGEPVALKIDAPPAGTPLAVRFYRLGWYQGLGARLVGSEEAVSVDQPPCTTRPFPSLHPAGGAHEELLSCASWATTVAWQPPADVPSGVYLARVERLDTGAASHVPFVVRDDGADADVLVQTADTTWQAYNAWPLDQPAGRDGHSLYSIATPHANAVSYDRPTLAVIEGPGGAPVLDDPAWLRLHRFEVPVIRFLERNGYDVSYTTGAEVDRRGDLLLRHRVFVSMGHDEYWSGTQRRNVEAARDAGVSLLFLSGNELYWKVRWEDDHRTLVCFKEGPTKLDPEPGVATALFRNPAYGAPYDAGVPQNALTGQIGAVSKTLMGKLSVPAEVGRLRFWRDTPMADLVDGQVATTATTVVGFESDADVDNGHRPAGLLHLSESVFDGQSSSLLEEGVTAVPHAMTLYRAPSGAFVFAAGTMQVAWGLDGFRDQTEHGGEEPALQQGIVNQLADMGALPQTLSPPLRAPSGAPPAVPPTAEIAALPTAAGVGETVRVAGTAAATDGRVGAVEVSSDGGLTWHPAAGREAWTWAFTPCEPGDWPVRARAIGDGGLIGPATPAVVVRAQGAGGLRNGLFACGFAQEGGAPVGWAAVGGATVGNGSKVPGGGLARMVGAAPGAGLEQHVALGPGAFRVTAQVLAETGAAALQVGGGATTKHTGRWETLTVPAGPGQAVVRIVAASAGATFKVREVRLDRAP